MSDPYKIYASQDYVNEKISDAILDDTEALELSAELGLIEPASAEDGAIYVDENDAIYVLD